MVFSDSDPVAPPGIAEALEPFLGLLGATAVIGFLVMAVGVIAAVVYSRMAEAPSFAVRFSVTLFVVGLVVAVAGGLPWLLVRRMAEDVAIANAHEVPARFIDAREPVPVRARIAWATGDELIDTYAVAWTSQLVLVQLSDPRYQLRGVWLAPADVERRAVS